MIYGAKKATGQDNNQAASFLEKHRVTIAVAPSWPRLGGFSALPILGLRTVYLSVVPLLAVIATDQGHPLSIEEEKEQSER